MRLFKLYLITFFVAGFYSTLSAQTVLEAGIGTHYYHWLQAKDDPNYLFSSPEDDWKIAKAVSLSLRTSITKRSFVRLSSSYHRITRRPFFLLHYGNYTDLYKSDLLSGDITCGLKLGFVSLGIGYTKAYNLNEFRTYSGNDDVVNSPEDYKESTNYSKDLSGYVSFVQCNIKNFSVSLTYRRLFNKTVDIIAYPYFEGIKSLELKLNYGIVFKKRIRKEKEGCDI